MPKQHYFFRQDGQLKKINLDNVVFLEAAKNYTKFNTLDGDYLLRISLNAAMDLLPKDKFLRVHRSFAVSFNHINQVGRDTVTFTAFPQLEIPVSRPYYIQFTKEIVILDSNATDPEEQPRKTSLLHASQRTAKNNHRK